MTVSPNFALARLGIVWPVKDIHTSPRKIKRKSAGELEKNLGQTPAFTHMHMWTCESGRVSKGKRTSARVAGGGSGLGA